MTRLKNTAVQIAARWNFIDILKLIFTKVSRSSDCTNCIVDLLLHQNSEGKNAFLCAADYNNFEAVQLLIITAESVTGTTDNSLVYKMLSVCDKNGRSILHMLSQFPSCTMKHPEHKERLYCLQDYEGNTALHRFAGNYKEDGIKLLLHHMSGFRTTSVLRKPNDCGQMPIHFARSETTKPHLNWAEKITNEFYYLPTAPAFVIMYNTFDRPGGIEEKDSIRDAALSDLDIEPTMARNPTTAQVFDSIGDGIIGAGGPEASGIIVIVRATGMPAAFKPLMRMYRFKM